MVLHRKVELLMVLVIGLKQSVFDQQILFESLKRTASNSEFMGEMRDQQLMINGSEGSELTDRGVIYLYTDLKSI
jgi:hypothetical protein